MPQALQLPLLCLGTASDPTDFVAVVREAMRLGGCSASRALFVGACAGALSSEPLPDAWLARFGQEKRDEVEGIARKIAVLTPTQSSI